MRKHKVFGLLIFPITALVVVITGFAFHLRSPAPGLLTLCAVLTVAQFALAARQAGAAGLRIEELRADYQAQLKAVTQKARQHEADATGRTAQIRSLEAELEFRQQEIETQRAETDSQRQIFEAEARRMTEQVCQALSGQVEAHSRQLEAVNIAMQYHRADLQQVWQGMRSLASGYEAHGIQQIPHALIEETEPDGSVGPFQATMNAPSTVVVEMPIYEIEPGDEHPIDLPERRSVS